MTASMLNLLDILTYAVRNRASDIHLVPGHVPMLSIDKKWSGVEDFGVVQPEDSQRMTKEMVGEKRFARLLEQRDLDFSTYVKGLSRFRVNAHFQRSTIGIAFRVISDEVPEFATLNLPAIVQGLAQLPRGLVLVTGPTGSGKSTTLASLVDTINRTIPKHVITLEDPVEYLISSRKSVVEQREVGSDVPNFASGLKHALRQAPDVILVGEMRDLETTSAAITAAETGHLVLSTLHTQSAHQTIERIVDIYPGEQKRFILGMLSNTLQAVVTQTLLSRADREGMIPACEVMLCNPAVRNCIRENRIHEIPNIIETNRSQGMCLLDDSLKTLLLNGMITREQALSRAEKPDALNKLLVA